jgi:hypothetical protein
MLDDGQFPHLNRTFYWSEPADYFERRLQLLILQTSRPEGLNDLFREGLSVGKLKVTYDPNPDEDEDSRRVREHYATTEVELLSHQLGETLLRLYLAHAFVGKRPPRCPRLDLARLRQPDDFRRAVERRFGNWKTIDDPVHRKAVARTFYFTEDREAIEPSPAEELWDRTLALHEHFLRFFAGQFLSASDLYNAAKHGLALTAGESSMELEGFFKRSGPSIRYLAVRRTPKGPRWSEMTHWVEADRQMAFVYQGCAMMRNLWAVARHRYVHGRYPDLPIRFLKGETPTELAAKDHREGPFILHDAGIELAYLMPDRDEL